VGSGARRASLSRDDSQGGLLHRYHGGGSSIRPRSAAFGCPLGMRGTANRRSCVSSRRLCGPHNSAIAGDHDQARDAATATVANQESHGEAKQQRDGCRQRRVIRLAHLPGDAAVPPGAARLLSAWRTRSLRPQKSSSALAAVRVARFGLRISRAMQPCRRARRGETSSVRGRPVARRRTKAGARRMTSGCGRLLTATE
jgi:hypothetical protein